MPLALQSRPLRVIAEREVRPVGAVRPRGVDLRVLSASHRPLGELVAGGQFCEDLFYRLAAATLHLPPLRDRCDFAWILARLLERHGDGRALVVTPAAIAMLRAHRWPGNIRELDDVVAVAAAPSDTGVIDCADLPETLARDAAPALDDVATTLAACGGNMLEAARRLGVDRTTVHRRLRRLVGSPQG